MILAHWLDEEQRGWSTASSRSGGVRRLDAHYVDFAIA